MNVPSRIFPTFLYVSKYWHHWWFFLRAPVSQSSGLATWENNSWSPLAGVCVCVCVCACMPMHVSGVPACGCLCIWTVSGPWLIQPLVFPGDLRCGASPCCGQACVSSSLWWAASASPVGPEVLLFPVTLEVTTLLLPSPLPSVFRLRGSYFLLYLWWIRATPGIMWTHCVWTPENLWVGACLLVFIYEASFLETTMTVNPELLNLMKCK